MSSTIWPARSALVRLSRASSVFAGVQVAFSYPTSREQHEIIGLGGIFEPTEEEAAIGGQRKAESYRLGVGIRVANLEKTATDEAVEARAGILTEGVRDIVHGRARNGDRSLDGALGGSGWATVASIESQGVRPIQGGGFVIFVRVMIACQARIA